MRKVNYADSDIFGVKAFVSLVFRECEVSMAASTIIVSYKDGGKAVGKKVEMSINGASCKPAFTDSSGQATIEHTSSGEAKVYIDGKCVARFRAPGRTSAVVP